MSKRQEIRARRQRQRLINRLLVIGLVILGVGLISAAIILPNLPQPEVPLTSITPAASRNFNAPVDMNSIGNPNAPVRVDVWEDFQCPACQYYSQGIEPLIIKNYVETGKVYYTYHFSIGISKYAPGNNESQHAANAAMCAGDQGKFWEYHDVVYANWKGENIGGFADNRLVAFAQYLGLNMDEFNSCFESDKYADFVAEDYQAGQDKGGQGTPAIFVNDVLVVSPRGENLIANFEEISVYIEEALAGK